MDEDKTKKPTDYWLGTDVSTFGTDELDETIARLRAEIERLEAEKAARHGTRSAAEALFSRGG